MTYFARHKLTRKVIELADDAILPDGYALLVRLVDHAPASPHAVVDSSRANREREEAYGATLAMLHLQGRAHHNASTLEENRAFFEAKAQAQGERELVYNPDGSVNPTLTARLEHDRLAQERQRSGR